MACNKANGSWWMTLGLWRIEQGSDPIHVALPSIATILDNLVVVLRIYEGVAALVSAAGQSAGSARMSVRESMDSEPTGYSRPGYCYKVLESFGWVRCAVSPKL